RWRGCSLAGSRERTGRRAPQQPGVELSAHAGRQLRAALARSAKRSREKRREAKRGAKRGRERRRQRRSGPAPGLDAEDVTRHGKLCYHPGPSEEPARAIRSPVQDRTETEAGEEG